jgi:hypothetical protein
MRTLKSFMLICLCAGTLYSQAQVEETPEWMNVLFGAEVVSTMGADKIAYYVFADQNTCTVEDVSPKNIQELPDALVVLTKAEGAPQLTEELIESNDFHYQLYRFSQAQTSPVYYRIGDSGKLLTVKSVKRMTELQQNQAQ